MNYLSKVNEQWIPLQANVFSRWVSSKLKRTNHPIDITKDLSDGTALVELAQTLTHHKVEREWAQKPNLNVEKVQNCDLAIDMFSKDGVRLVGISGKDINDNNEKLILGLIWSLILHYSIGESIQRNSFGDEIINSKDNNSITNNYFESEDQKVYSHTEQQQVLMDWATKRIEKYPNITDFEPYELAMCALLDSYFPDKIRYDTLKPENHLNNSELATDVMIEYGIPVFIYTDDLKKNNYEVDNKTLLTQLAFVKTAIDNANIKKGLDITDISENVEGQSKSESNSYFESEKELEDENEQEFEEDENEQEVEEDENEQKVEEKENSGYSSEEDLVSEPEFNESRILAKIQDSEVADDEKTEESELNNTDEDENENDLGLQIGFQDKRHGDKKNSKKRIRIKIRNGNKEDGYQITESDEINSFMNKYLHLTNPNGENPLAKKSIKVRVKYHGHIIEKIIHAPFHQINVHLHHHHHHHHHNDKDVDQYEEEMETTSCKESESDDKEMKDVGEVNDEEEEINDAVDDEENLDNRENVNDEESFEDDFIENFENQKDSEAESDELEENATSTENDDGDDLEERAEMEDEIEAAVEKEFEAEADEKEILESEN